MSPLDHVPNTGLSDDARTFDRIIQVREPVEDEIYYAMVNSPFPFDVVEIYYFLTTGELDFMPKADGQVIDTDQTDSSGLHHVDQPTGTTAIPDGSIFTVAEGGSLSATVSSVGTLVDTLLIQFVCRRTDEKVVITP